MQSSSSKGGKYSLKMTTAIKFKGMNAKLVRLVKQMIKQLL